MMRRVNENIGNFAKRRGIGMDRLKGIYHSRLMASGALPVGFPLSSSFGRVHAMPSKYFEYAYYFAVIYSEFDTRFRRHDLLTDPRIVSRGDTGAANDRSR